MTQQLRTVLAEIPDRLDALRVGNTPNQRHVNRLSDTITPPTPPTLFDNTTNVALSGDQEQVQLMSPDELVIKQRGRRRLTAWMLGGIDDVTESDAEQTPFQSTPTKILTTSMILRSSPRKRLSMGTLPPLSVPATPSPKKMPRADVTPAKRTRLCAERPLAQLNTDLPLCQLLNGLSSVQLIDIIINKLVAGDAQIEQKLRQQLPLPDIRPQELELSQAKRNIYKSLPTSRLCPRTDSTAYARAVTHLNEFKRLVAAHTKQLNDTGHWDALLDYVHMAWPYVRATPIWDNTVHNAVRRECFKMLSCCCLAALKHGRLHLGAMRLQRLEQQLPNWECEYEDAVFCKRMLAKILHSSRNSM